MRNQAFSIFEILIVLSLIAGTFCLCISGILEFVQHQFTIISVRQLQLAINYGRSLAILHHEPVTVCPSHNRHTCGGSWQQGFLVVTSNAKAHFFASFTRPNCLVFLTQSGNTNAYLTINPDGMTYTNGHFTFKLLNSGNIPQYNLYFNKALRLYATRSAYLKNDISVVKHNRAFTLIEMITVIAIVAILVSVAYPSYIRIKMESRRVDATGALIATQGIVQRYLAENNLPQFTSTQLALTQFANYSTTASTPKLSDNGYYVITIVPDSGGYAINATATVTGGLTDCNSGTNANFGQCRDTQCRIISIKDGAQQSTNSVGVVANASTTECW